MIEMKQLGRPAAFDPLALSSLLGWAQIEKDAYPASRLPIDPQHLQ